MKGSRLCQMVAALVVVGGAWIGLAAPAGRDAAGSPATSTRSADASIRVGFGRVGGGYNVETLALEDYVARVVAGEADAASTPAALAVVAITARTFALANLRRHRADGFDLCDLTHCQVLRRSTTLTRASADGTSGQVLLYNGAPASVYYSASCGGQTELPSAVWAGAPDPPFLVSRPDPAHAMELPWTAEISESALISALRESGSTGGSLHELQILRRTASGRAGTLRVQGLTPDTISGADFRLAVGRTLGWNLLKSTAFDVERMSGGYRFIGRGFGHGVGLCVIGSTRMAADGATPAAILHTYFPGLVLGPIPPSTLARSTSGRAPAVSSDGRVGSLPAPPAPPVTVVLPASDEDDRAVIEASVTDFLDTLLKRTALPRPERLVVRFHPTVESFRRGTGQPWWVAAASSGSEIQVLPASVLRVRGTLDSTLRHEVAHVVTARLLEGRKRWVKEGAAIYFSGEPFGVPLSRVTCPDDQEIALASSAGALRDAYGRASACFVQQIDAGKRWDEVR